VKDGGGNAVANASVTFTAPSSGASATFSNSATTYTTATNSSGIATSLALTANSTAGSYSVTAAVTGVATAASFALTNVNVSTLSVTESVTTFVQGQTSIFTLTVVNAANAGPTSGTVAVMLGAERAYGDRAQRWLDVELQYTKRFLHNERRADPRIHLFDYRHRERGLQRARAGVHWSGRIGRYACKLRGSDSQRLRRIAKRQH
jgi:hypothetical protein